MIIMKYTRYNLHCTGYRIQGTIFRIRDEGQRMIIMKDTRYNLHDTGFMITDKGFKIH